MASLEKVTTPRTEISTPVQCRKKYVLDFYCVEEWLAVELDGEVHNYDDALITIMREHHFSILLELR